MKGVSERIHVRSIVGRLLEHERILQFGDRVWIGSADWMPRNLDRRVEVLVRVCDPRHVDDLEALIERGMGDDYSHWRLGGDGRWMRHHVDDDGVALPDLQAALIEMHAKRRRKARRR